MWLKGGVRGPIKTASAQKPHWCSVPQRSPQFAIAEVRVCANCCVATHSKRKHGSSTGSSVYPMVPSATSRGLTPPP
eukprot:9417625-Lingulodinium_polyedra.AAC.1